MPSIADHQPLEQIPPPNAVRNQLARLVREARLARKLLRLSEQVHQERERQRREEAASAN
jgi:hypothetical protein